MRTTRHNSAFTLLELVLVMVIICTAVAVAAPSLSGWRHGSALRDSADSFVMLTRRASAVAVAEAVTCRVTVDASAGTFSLTKASLDGLEFAAVAGTYGRPFSIPEGATITMEGSSDGVLEFLPTGRMTASTVHLSDDRGYTVDIVCNSPAEGYAVVMPNADANGGMQ